ncbi:MAG: PAS domain S-box protein, partial [Terracidiphilus sp.]
PVDPALTERLLGEAEDASLGAISGQEQSDSDARDAIQDIRESGQDLREYGQDTREASQDLREAGADLRETAQDARENAQDFYGTSQDTRDVSADARETAQDTRETNQNTRETTQDSRKAKQDLQQSSQDIRKASQDTRESGLNLREAGEDFLLSGKALLNLEARYQLLVDSVTDYAIYMLDPEGRVVTWNVGAERSKGYKAEEILGKHFSIFFLPEDVKAGLPADELATAESQGRYECEAWRVRKDGTKFWALVTLTAIRDPSGELHGYAKVTRDMTVQKNAEEAARSHRTQLERYRIIVENVTDYVIFTLDAEGRFTSWGPTAERDTGIPTTEMLGRPYSWGATEEDRLAGLPEMELEEAARTGRCAQDSWRVRRDGSLFWATGVLSAVRDETGKLIGYVRVGRDMTPQKQAEDELKRLNAQLERYRLIVGSVADYVIFTLDAEGRIDSWSIGAQNVLGYTVLEALGQDYSLVFTTAQRDAGQPQWELEEAARAGHCPTESWRVRKDGSLFWASGALTAVRDASGTLTGYIRVARDMTEQKQAEEQLKSLNAQLERYRIIVENITDHLIYTLDAEGRIDSWSPSAQSLVGRTAEDALGQDYALSFLPEEIEAGEPQRQLEEAARNGYCITAGWRKRGDGSESWSTGVLTAVRDSEGTLTGYIRVARDMTLQKRLEESLERVAIDMEKRVAERTSDLKVTIAELQRKNQEVEAFVHIVSHDLRAPLVNVQGFVRELQESCRILKIVIQSCPQWEFCWPGVRPILEDEIGGALHYISASTTKFERLLNALLALSRQGRQVYQLTRVNVWELVTNSVATFQRIIAEVEAKVVIGVLPSATADMTALGQVFSNLIGNAIKYRSPERTLRVEIGGQIEGETVHYWVRDNGLGIPEYGKTKLFQVFQRFHRQQAEGEGMGLAIAHRIVERLGGKIWAESQEGAGSTFHFSLPANPAALQKITSWKTEDDRP